MVSTERLSPHESQGIERFTDKKRKRIAALLAASTFIFMGIMHEGGFRLLPSRINTETKTYEELVDWRNGNAFILTEAYLHEGKVYERSHRSGNTLESIDEAIEEKGAEIIDVDVTVVNGVPYGEHGLVFKEEVLGSDITLVVDPVELELSTKMPTRLEDLVRHVAGYNTPEEPPKYSLNLELKHGDYTYEVLEKIVDILLEYQTPAIIQPDQQDSGERVETIRAVYNQRINASAITE